MQVFASGSLQLKEQNRQKKKERDFFACTNRNTSWIGIPAKRTMLDLPALAEMGLGFEAQAAAEVLRAGLGVVPRPVSFAWPQAHLVERTLAQAAGLGRIGQAHAGAAVADVRPAEGRLATRAGVQELPAAGQPHGPVLGAAVEIRVVLDA
jgi:hypothetical protein